MSDLDDEAIGRETRALMRRPAVTTPPEDDTAVPVNPDYALANRVHRAIEELREAVAAAPPTGGTPE